MHMYHSVALQADVLTILPSVTAEGKYQACKVLLPAHDAFLYILMYKSKLGDIDYVRVC